MIKKPIYRVIPNLSNLRAFPLGDLQERFETTMVINMVGVKFVNGSESQCIILNVIAPEDFANKNIKNFQKTILPLKKQNPCMKAKIVKGK